MNMCVQLVRNAKWQAGRLDNSSTKTMMLVRNTGLMFIYSGDFWISQKGICGLDGHTSQKTKTTIVSEWGPEMVSEGLRIVCLDRGQFSNAALSNFLRAMQHSPSSREQCSLPFSAWSHAFSRPVWVLHSFVSPHPFVPCDKESHSVNTLHFPCTCSSDVHNLQSSRFTSEPCSLYCDLSEYSK